MGSTARGLPTRLKRDRVHRVLPSAWTQTCCTLGFRELQQFVACFGCIPSSGGAALGDSTLIVLRMLPFHWYQLTEQQGKGRKRGRGPGDLLNELQLLVPHAREARSSYMNMSRLAAGWAGRKDIWGLSLAGMLALWPGA